MPTFGDLYLFVLKNKTDKTFIGYTNEWIAWLLKQGIDNGTLLYSVDDEDNITGMILAEDRPKEKVLFVTENLAMNIKNLREFAKIAKQRRPGWKLEWLKHGIHKQHNTDKIYEKLHAD